MTGGPVFGTRWRELVVSSLGDFPGRCSQSLHDVWSCRYFWATMAYNDLRHRYRRSLLGMGWSLLNPLAMSAVICFAFHGIFQIPIAEYVIYLLTGFAVWTFVSAVVSEGCMTFYRSEGFIRSYPAPLSIYPLRVALGLILHLAMILVATSVLAWMLKGSISLLAIASLVPTLGLFFLLGWGLAVLLGIANVYLPDTQHLVQIGLQILFYLTPIIYPANVVGQKGFAALLQFNPLTSFITLIRDPVIHDRLPTLACYLGASATTALLVSVAGYLVIKAQNDLVFKL